MLELISITKSFNVTRALDNVSLAVSAGEIVSLLGRNGVGRSTTIKSIMGQVSSTGSVRFKGEEINGLKAYMVARKGLGYVPENREIFPTLTVRQNLMLGMKNASRSETEQVVQLIRQVTAGKTLLMVEHDMSVVFNLADRISVLVYGEVIASGTPQEIRGNKAVQEAYLGTEQH